MSIINEKKPKIWGEKRIVEERDEEGKKQYREAKCQRKNQRAGGEAKLAYTWTGGSK